MGTTPSQTVHEAVMASKMTSRSLDTHESALRIATIHGIDSHRIWLVEQALVMVGSRAGIGMKIGRDAYPSQPRDDRPPQFG